MDAIDRIDRAEREAAQALAEAEHDRDMLRVVAARASEDSLVRLALLREVEAVNPGALPQWLELTVPLLLESREPARFGASSEPLERAALSPDGARVVSLDPRGVVELWSATSGVRERGPRRLGRAKPAGRVLELSPDGGALLVAGADHSLELWDIRDDGRAKARVTLRGHRGPLLAAAFSPDGRWIASASADHTVRLWGPLARADAEGAGAAPPSYALRGHEGSVRSVAFSPDNARVLSASDDGTARVWSVQAGRAGQSAAIILRGHEGRLRGASFGDAGRRVLTIGRDDGTARVWAADGSGRARVIGNPLAPTLAAAIDPASARVVTATRGGVLTLLELADDDAASPLTLARGGPELRALAFSPDGGHVAAGAEDGVAYVWSGAALDAEPLALRGHGGPVEELAFSTSSSPSPARDEARRETTLLARTDAGVATRWRLAPARAGEPPRRRGAALPGVTRELTGHSAELVVATPSRDGARVVTGSDDMSARLWSTSPTRLIAVLRGHTGWVRSAAFARGGAQLITGSVDGSARVWSAEDGRGLATLSGHGAPVTAVALSPDGARAVTATTTGTLRSWRLDASGEAQRLRATDSAAARALSGHETAVWALAFSPDGRWLLSGSRDGAVQLQRVDGAQGAPTRLDAHDWRVHDLEFADDGIRFVTASGDQRARLWRRVGDGAPRLAREFEHDAEVASARLLEGGARLLTTTYDDAMWIWPLDQEDAPPRIIRGDALASARVSADGRVAVTRHARSGARVWTLEPLALHAALWRVPALCLPPARRVELLGETGDRARRAFAECEARARG